MANDDGAIERNVRVNQIALERASQRNGGQHQYPSPPSSVTGVGALDAPAVSVTKPTGFGKGGER